MIQYPKSDTYPTPQAAILALEPWLAEAKAAGHAPGSLLGYVGAGTRAQATLAPRAHFLRASFAGIDRKIVKRIRDAARMKDPPAELRVFLLTPKETGSIWLSRLVPTIRGLAAEEASNGRR